jgi:hypothetical protein
MPKNEFAKKKKTNQLKKIKEKNLNQPEFT